MRDFKHTMDVLVRAYFDDTLIHGHCAGCAVGNICANAAGVKVRPHGELASWSKGYPVWDNVFMTAEDEDGVFRQKKTIAEYQDPRVKEQIDATGYTWKELARIEFAFESAEQGKSKDDHMFNGLIAVLEVLADIHKVDFSGYQVYEKQLAEIHATK